MGSITIDVGPPCAGKSTYVEANRKDGDVVIDTDALAKAIGSNSPHSREGLHRSLVFGARQSLISRVVAGVDADSWVIHTSPSPQMVDRYLDAGAKFVQLDPGQEECLARAEKDGRPDGTAEVILAWYESPPVLTRTGSNKGVVWLY